MEDKVTELRQRLHGVNLKFPKSIPEISKAIGVTVPTITSFLKAKKTPSYESMLKIEAYIISKE